MARTPGTKVILMGVERLREIATALVGCGMAADTPVGVVRWATTGRQQSLQGTLATIADLAADQQFTAPAVTVIGDVVKLRPTLNWFEHRPLFGRRIAVTRTREQASQLTRRLLELGADVLEVPTIRIAPPDDRQPVLEALEGLGEYDWIVFTSPNGVTAFFDCLFKAFEDVRALGQVRLAAVGPATAAKLKELHLRVDVMPDEYLASKVAKGLIHYESVENLRILLARAQVANPELCTVLESHGAIVDDVAFYKTVPETEDFTGAAARLSEAGADWITFTSSSTVQHFHARFDLPKFAARFPGLRLASIGPETTKAITALGLSAAVEARPHTIEGLVKALQAAARAKTHPPSAEPQAG
jgi:uroporphyrinogen III methyltransferase/synthase